MQKPVSRGPNLVPLTKGYRSTHTGNKFSMLVPAAIPPVMNGNTAEPAEPKLAIHPTAPAMSSGGRTPPAWFMTMGKMGPRKRPTRETATAPPIREGTNQTTRESPRVRRR